MSRILVTGSRSWSDYDTVCRGLAVAIETIKKQKPDDKRIVIVHGNAKGADTMAATFVYQFQDYLKEKGYSLVEEAHPANWKIGKQAGPIRNEQMIDAGADICVAFNEGGPGTAHCMALAKRAGIEVLEYTP